MIFIAILTILLISYGLIEYRLHLRNVLSIPIRIHVNGTRGKSSVTRLIAAGLRAGGIHTVAKTTGTSPRMIFEDGSEIQIQRVGKANIKEQIPIIRHFAKLKPQAIVMECMAVQPLLQWIAEHRLVHSTIGVITNARPDHLDVMGPEVEDVARSLASTIPPKGIMFTCEQNQIEIFRQEAAKCQAQIVQVIDYDLSEAEMQGFSYVEWKSNVALALAVCAQLGVPRRMALAGMYSAQPDVGVLRVYRIDFFNKVIEFANGFAANDPESTLLLSDNLGIGKGDRTFAIYIVNCRADKIQRSQQLAELIAGPLPGKHFVLTGEFTRAVYDHAVRLGQDESMITDMGGKNVEEIFETIVELAQPRTIVVGVGNVVGLGQEIVNYFASRGLNENMEHFSNLNLTRERTDRMIVW